MNNEKIGLFISRERKARQLTQKELAEKLNVTDKAVSKWERGLSYPDISLLIPISDILSVNVSELLNGERSEDETITAVTHIAVENALEYASNVANRKTKSIRKRAIIAAFGACIFLFSLTLALFQPVSGLWNARIHRSIIRVYLENVDQLSQVVIDEHFQRAYDYNALLRDIRPHEPLLIGRQFLFNQDEYTNILYINGVIGRIEIPGINVDLPIFHDPPEGHFNTNWSMQRGVNHLAGTAFPIGGYGNHSVIYGFSGPANNRIFKHLALIDIGDTFYITVLNQRLAYQVDNILIVYPHEVQPLRVIPDADLVTLISCVPYRIGTHRLLVRGKRVPYVSGMAASNVY